MQKDVKKLWVDALRGNAYQQISDKLRGGGARFCVLGVLCDIFEQTTKQRLSEQETSQNVLPRRVADWAGLKERNPTIHKLIPNSNYLQLNLSSYNDGKLTKKHNFKELACLIEENL